MDINMILLIVYHLLCSWIFTPDHSLAHTGLMYDLADNYVYCSSFLLWLLILHMLLLMVLFLF
jgi:hypothetical protein